MFCSWTKNIGDALQWSAVKALVARILWCTERRQLITILCSADVLRNNFFSHSNYYFNVPWMAHLFRTARKTRLNTAFFAEGELEFRSLRLQSVQKIRKFSPDFYIQYRTSSSFSYIRSVKNAKHGNRLSIVLHVIHTKRPAAVHFWEPVSFIHDSQLP